MATKIKRFSITQPSLAAHSLFHDQIDEEITKYDLPVIQLEELAPLYTIAVAAERAAVNRPTAFSETPQMVEADHKRDQSITMLVGIINIYGKSTQENEIAAAQRLHAIIAPYHGMQAHEYYRETTETNGMLAALATALPADIALFNLSSVIEQIATHNTTFKQLIAERKGDVIVRTPVSITDSQELRQAADALYLQMVERVNAFIITTPSPELETFAVAINAIITHIKLVIANQGKSKKETNEPIEESQTEM